MIPLSVLDLAPILEGADAAQSFRNSLDLARHTERLGYQRFWVAEHHAMPGVASAATAVCIAHVAAGTSTIRVGAGGIMLPNHAPLVIAEQFGTLAALHPGRIDLGVGRAPGTDQIAAQALRRTLAGDVDRFPQDVMELMAYFEPAQPNQRVVSVPGAGLEVPVWILGSSTYGAQLAAHLGLPYAFASHFAPQQMEMAIAIYRRDFQPSKYLAKPYVMLGSTGVAADTEDEAKRLFTSVQQQFLSMRTGRPGLLQPPVENIEERFAQVGMSPDMQGALAMSLVGSAATIRGRLEGFMARYAPDELIITSQIYDHQARLRSYEIIAQVRDEMARAAA